MSCTHIRILRDVSVHNAMLMPLHVTYKLHAYKGATCSISKPYFIPSLMRKYNYNMHSYPHIVHVNIFSAHIYQHYFTKNSIIQTKNLTCNMDLFFFFPVFNQENIMHTKTQHNTKFQQVQPAPELPFPKPRCTQKCTTVCSKLF